MFCGKCGKNIETDSKFCCYCGNAIENVVENTNSDNEIVETNSVLFFDGLIGRDILEKGLYGINELLTVVVVMLSISFIYEQYNLNEGYVFWIYVIRYMIKFAFLMILGEIIRFMSELFTYRISDLKRKDLKFVLLGCKSLDLIMIFIMVYPFLFVSDITLTGWVLRFAFGGTEEFFYEFRVQIIAIIIRMILAVYLNKKVIKETE